MRRFHLYWLPVLLLTYVMLTSCAAQPGTGAASASSSSVTVSSEAPRASGGCKIGGCSGQLCVEESDDGVSNCLWKAEYACYRTAICGRQTDGLCGWNVTPKLQACLRQTADAGNTVSASSASGKHQAAEGQFCGGIAGIPCGDGLTCHMAGSYPDAGGTCVRS
jgi:hypothetical protein